MKSVRKFSSMVFSIVILSTGILPASAVVRLGDLGPLEIKFFAHQYDRETPTERLNRLEKLVFGETQTGSIEERVAKISKTVDVASPDVPKINSSKQVSSGNSSKAQSAESKNSIDSSTSDYPRVSELERSLLGRSYAGEPVRQRLSRLEVKAYGAPSRVDDLTVRVDKLTSYAGVYGMQPGDVAPGGSGRPDNLPGAAVLDANSQTRSSGMLDRVSAMEVKVFGHENTYHALVQRIKDLENNVLGSAASNSKEDMTTRVNQLWASAKINGNAQQDASVQTSLRAQTTESLKAAQTLKSAQTLQPFSSGNSQQQFSPYSSSNNGNNGYNSAAYTSNNFPNNQYSSGTSSKHKSKGQHGSFLGKIGKVVAFAGSAAVGAGGLAVGAVGNMSMGSYGMGMGSYGMGTGFGAPYSYGSYAPRYGSVSSISSFGNMSSGSTFGSPFNSSYAGSFYSP